MAHIGGIGAEQERRKIRRLIDKYRRALDGFAHYDKGEKVEGCDCCYCAPKQEVERE